MNDTAILWKQYRAFVQGSISPRRLETAEIRNAIAELSAKGVRSTEIETMAAEIAFDPNWKAWGSITDLQLLLRSLHDRMEVVA